MKYTELENQLIKKHIASVAIPIEFTVESNEKIILSFKNDKEISIKLTKIFQYEATGKNSDGSLAVFSNKDFQQFIMGIRSWLKKIKTDNPNIISKNTTIENFSPNFYNVFQEATMINCLNYKESAGMVYRKSLEIIIKDFLLKFLPEFENIILSETVGGLVFFFYDNIENILSPRKKRKFKRTEHSFDEIQNQLNEILPLINFVNNTFKIGNDFSHYERRLEKYTTEDLENNINQIIQYLESKYSIIETTRKLELINKNFKNYNL
ncbi:MULTISPECIES: hypothetical protein [Gaetbulibacter]|uniref:hypothetical protein n=1 Tax=Gaetbulibacter TaxID=311207 RepID=UPI0021CEC1C8|nr:hypothetical protein [Gaetbulibacter sp. NE]